MASAPISALISLVCGHQMLYKLMGLASLSMRAIYSGVEQHVVLPRIYGKYTAKEDVWTSHQHWHTVEELLQLVITNDRSSLTSSNILFFCAKRSSKSFWAAEVSYLSNSSQQQARCAVGDSWITRSVVWDQVFVNYEKSREIAQQLCCVERLVFSFVNFFKNINMSSLVVPYAQITDYWLFGFWVLQNAEIITIFDTKVIRGVILVPGSKSFKLWRQRQVSIPAYPFWREEKSRPCFARFCVSDKHECVVWRLVLNWK